MSQLSIVMYHYVRPIQASQYPGIKGLEVEGFLRQLDYLEDRFNIVSVDEIIACAMSGKALPDNACWLTFDDGYKDHIQYVYPELKRRGLQGSFFVPKAPVQDSELLDVNSIHHILACCDERDELRSKLDRLCLEASFSAVDLERLWGEYGVANRFDDATTIYIKRMLQHALPESVRHSITSQLFQEYVGVSQSEFSTELYMSTAEVRELVDNGMHVGSHGSRHYWLDRISVEEQRLDIGHSLEFLEEVGAPTQDWVMCYPYGGYNSQTLSLLQEMGAALGVTTEVRRADLQLDNPLTLPRFDTNDFPQ